jgi:hypothetical protein
VSLTPVTPQEMRVRDDRLRLDVSNLMRGKGERKTLQRTKCEGVEEILKRSLAASVNIGERC